MVRLILWFWRGMVNMNMASCAIKKCCKQCINVDIWLGQSININSKVCAATNTMASSAITESATPISNPHPLQHQQGTIGRAACRSHTTCGEPADSAHGWRSDGFDGAWWIGGSWLWVNASWNVSHLTSWPHLPICPACGCNYVERWCRPRVWANKLNDQVKTRLK